PDPDACAYAARIFDLPPAEVTLIQTDPACMAAGKAAGFGTIIGIGQGDLADRLYEAGATAVVMALPESAEP
ncbi:MAG: hypothetical protein LBM66_06915, partial [Bifidobacteriaceae bacterium]|nr:hypothetical protein [Bifidobacteriaceae bacterium]